MTDFYSQNRCVCSTRSHGPLLCAFCLSFHFKCYILIREEFLLAELLPGAMTCKRYRPTIAKNNNAKKKIAKYRYFVTLNTRKAKVCN